MKSSEYRKFSETPVKSTIKFSLIIVLTVFVSQCAFFQSQKNRTYRLTNKTFEADKTLTFTEKDKDILSLAMIDTDGKTDQLWQITPEGEDYYRIKNKLFADKSLEVFDGTNDNRTRLAESADDEGQLWEIIPVEKDFYRLSNKWLGPNKSVMTKKDEYYKISLEASSNNEAMLWKKIPVGNDYFRLVTKLHGNDVTLIPFDTGELGMEPAKDNTFTYQHWKMDSVGNDYYRIINSLDVYDKVNKSLEAVSPAQNKFTANMTPSTNSDTQRWKMESVGNDYFRLTNANGSSLQAVFISDYTLLMTDSDDNNPNQLWKIIRIK